MSEKQCQFVKYGLMVLGVVFILVSLIVRFSSWLNIRNDINDTNVLIANTQRDLLLQNAKLADSSAIQSNLFYATDDGDKVSSLQNQLISSDDDSMIEEQLLNLFTDDVVINWSDGLSENSNWSFMTRYGFSSLNCDVCWICSDSMSGQILKFVVASYDVNKHVFGNVQVLNVVDNFVDTDVDNDVVLDDTDDGTEDDIADENDVDALDEDDSVNNTGGVVIDE